MGENNDGIIFGLAEQLTATTAAEKMAAPETWETIYLERQRSETLHLLSRNFIIKFRFY